MELGIEASGMWICHVAVVMGPNSHLEQGNGMTQEQGGGWELERLT